MLGELLSEAIPGHQVLCWVFLFPLMSHQSCCSNSPFLLPDYELLVGAGATFHFL